MLGHPFRKGLLMTDTPKARKPAAKTTKKADAVAAPAAQDVKAVPETLKLKEFIELVGTAAGGNRKDVRRVVAATLQTLNERLQKDGVLLLPPLGRIRVVKDEAGMRTLKLRSIAAGKGAKPAKEALAGGDD
jgi:nucleoid DNA-binding protein